MVKDGRRGKFSYLPYRTRVWPFPCPSVIYTTLHHCKNLDPHIYTLLLSCVFQTSVEPTASRWFSVSFFSFWIEQVVVRNSANFIDIKKVFLVFPPFLPSETTHAAYNTRIIRKDTNITHACVLLESVYIYQCHHRHPKKKKKTRQCGIAIISKVHVLLQHLSMYRSAVSPGVAVDEVYIYTHTMKQKQRLFIYLRPENLHHSTYTGSDDKNMLAAYMQAGGTVVGASLPPPPSPCQNPMQLHSCVWFWNFFERSFSLPFFFLGLFFSCFLDDIIFIMPHIIRTTRLLRLQSSVNRHRRLLHAIDTCPCRPNRSRSKLVLMHR